MLPQNARLLLLLPLFVCMLLVSMMEKMEKSKSRRGIFVFKSEQTVDPYLTVSKTCDQVGMWKWSFDPVPRTLLPRFHSATHVGINITFGWLSSPSPHRPISLNCLVVMGNIALQASLLIPGASKPCAWARRHEKRMIAATISMLMRPILWECASLPHSFLLPIMPTVLHGLLQVIGILLYIYIYI